MPSSTTPINVASKKVGTLIGYSFVWQVSNAIVKMVARVKFGQPLGIGKNIHQATVKSSKVARSLVVAVKKRVDIAPARPIFRRQNFH
jgi:hypothetical protein